PLSSSSLSLQRSRPHAEPHPFPTRRSSDLSVMAEQVEMPERRRDEAAVREDRLPREGPDQVGDEEGPDDEEQEHVLPAPAAEREDRKSTRLNSSHEWISYAVFCLKKKKKQD